MLKVTFPHIGNAYIPFATLFNELGVEPVIPPLISDRTIALGAKIAPEFACFPLKVNLGNYLEAIEAGAEMILMAGGVGPCRFGYYGEVQREILRELGYDVQFLLLEAPKTHPRELWERIQRIFPRHTALDLMRALRLAWLKATALDQLDRLANRIRPVEQQPGQTTLLQQRFYAQLHRAVQEREIRQALQNGLAELRGLAVKNSSDVLRIMLVGEIYMVLEPRVNFDIERTLGEMGVLVERSIYLSDWIRDQLLFSIIRPDWSSKWRLLARPYLNSFVGGHGLETVAHTVAAGINRLDGVIQLAPFTCMPEIVAMQVLPDVSRELAIPFLSIIIDEHSAEAGVRTRLEAFVDLLWQKKRKAAGGEKLASLSGH